MSVKSLKELAREVVHSDNVLHESALRYPLHFRRTLGILPQNIVQIVLEHYYLADYKRMHQWYKEKGLYSNGTHQACLDAAEHSRNAPMLYFFYDNEISRDPTYCGDPVKWMAEKRERAAALKTQRETQREVHWGPGWL